MTKEDIELLALREPITVWTDTFVPLTVQEYSKVMAVLQARTRPPFGCMLTMFVSPRVCERGTQGCDVKHETP